MFNITLSFFEESVFAETGEIYEALHTKSIDCSTIVSQPDVLIAYDYIGNAFSFFHDKIERLIIEDTLIETVNQENINDVIKAQG